MTKRINYYHALTGFALLLALLAGIVFFGWLGIRPAAASVSVASEYYATSTAPSNVYGANTLADVLIKSGQGSLGSVVITGANTGVLNIWDATTTNVNLRTGQIATSSIRLLASIPASTVAGTYTFDVFYTTGLVYDSPGGIMPTSTITYR